MLQSGEINCVIESIVIFDRVDEYGVTADKRVTKKEWDEVFNHMRNLRTNFWKTIINK